MRQETVRFPSLSRRLLFVALIWVIAGYAVVSIRILTSVYFLDRLYWPSFERDFRYWTTLLPIGPLILILAERFSLIRYRLRTLVWIHLLGLAAACLTSIGVQYLVAMARGNRHPTVWLTYFFSVGFVYILLIYVATTAASWAEASARYTRQQSAERSRLRDNTAEQSQRHQRLALEPEQLIRELEQIEAVLPWNAEQATGRLERLSDDMRERLTGHPRPDPWPREESLLTLRRRLEEVQPRRLSVRPRWEIYLLIYGVLSLLIAIARAAFIPRGNIGRGEPWVSFVTELGAALWVAAFYPALLFLVRRITIGGKNWPSAVFLFYASFAICYLAIFSYGAILFHLPIYRQFFSRPIFCAAATVVTTNWLSQYSILALGAVAIGYVSRLHEGRRREEIAVLQEQVEAADTELRVLRNQLDPHFLGNCLNSLLALVDVDRERAEVMTRKLRMFYEKSVAIRGNNQVPIREELQFVRQYAEIQHLRYGDRLQLKIDADPGSLDCPVPTLMLQPLVENSIRHGVGRMNGPCAVAIRTRKMDGEVRLEIVNDTRPQQISVGGSGLGLVSTEARLRRIYGTAATMQAEQSEAHFQVVITIPCERQQ